MLPMIVVENVNRPTLLGRNWMKHLKLNWNEIFSVHSVNTHKGKLDLLLRKHSSLFTDSYDGLTGFEAKIHVRSDAKPVFCKPRVVPYALREAVENELDKLEKNGVIVKTERSKWASPLVVVPKKDKSVRLCGDYKVTLNQAVEDEQYSLPTTQDLYVALSGSKVFTKLDLSHAYAQLKVDSESSEYLTLNTHKGLYKYTKLAYGVKSSPKLFQRVMDEILQGVPSCVCKQDDILIGGRDEEENLKILEDVLTRLGRHNVHLKLEKCQFLKPRVVYLGFEFDATGIRPVESKIDAVRNAPTPKNVSELKSFLGMIQYYHAFLPNLASILEPLHALLRKDAKWTWSEKCQKSYDMCKAHLTSDGLLVHYEIDRELRLACDASSYGLGAVISHVMDNGEERPIAYASRSLKPSERNYAQIEREALSIVFGVKKFHQFLYGRKFTLITDHKPLLAILGPKSGIPTLAAARMQRWAIILSAYDYDIEYRSSGKHANCDALSRLPDPTPSSVACDSNVYSISPLDDDDFPVRAEQIATATRTEPVLSRVHAYVLSGWPDKCNDEALKPFFAKRNELSCDQGCILWGSRVVVPPKFREKILQELHWEHPGICSMKAIARSYVWWPNLDNAIENLVKECSACQDSRQTPSKLPLHPWKWPTRPFQRVHIDFFEFEKRNFLVLIDSHSKWVEVKPMNSTTAECTIDELRLIFAQHGLPQEVVSDNDPQFTSSEFASFMLRNGIVHTLVAPYHPASNGAAERTVRLVKEGLARQVLGGQKRSLKHRLADFLFRYRTTPHSVTGASPAELLTRRQFNTRLTLLKPDMSKQVSQKQAKQKSSFDKNKQVRVFEVDDEVRVKNTRSVSKTDKWCRGVVVGVRGPRNYVVRFGNSSKLVHADHMLKAQDNLETPGAVFSPSPTSVTTSASPNISSRVATQPLVTSGQSQNGNSHVQQREQSPGIGEGKQTSVENALRQSVSNSINTDSVPNQTDKLRQAVPNNNQLPKEPVSLRRSTRVKTPVVRLDM